MTPVLEALQFCCCQQNSGFKSQDKLAVLRNRGRRGRRMVLPPPHREPSRFAAHGQAQKH